MIRSSFTFKVAFISFRFTHHKPRMPHTRIQIRKHTHRETQACRMTHFFKLFLDSLQICTVVLQISLRIIRISIEFTLGMGMDRNMGLSIDVILDQGRIPLDLHRSALHFLWIPFRFASNICLRHGHGYGTRPGSGAHSTQHITHITQGTTQSAAHSTAHST